MDEPFSLWSLTKCCIQLWICGFHGFMLSCLSDFPFVCRIWLSIKYPHTNYLVLLTYFFLGEESNKSCALVLLIDIRRNWIGLFCCLPSPKRQVWRSYLQCLELYFNGSQNGNEVASYVNSKFYTCNFHRILYYVGPAKGIWGESCWSHLIGGSWNSYHFQYATPFWVEDYITKWGDRLVIPYYLGLIYGGEQISLANS